MADVLSELVDAGTGGSSASFLDQVPASPDARNEEFGGSFPGSFTAAGSWSAGGFDVYTDTGVLTTVRYDWNSGRPGWLLTQPGRSSGGSNYLHKAITVETNMQIWIHAQFNIKINVGGECSVVAIVLGQTSAGVLDVNNAVYISIRQNASNQYSHRVEKFIAGVYTNAGDSSPAPAQQATTPVYLLLQKTGTSYYLWYAGASGEWISGTTSTTAAITPDRVGLFIQNACASGGSPVAGPPLMNIDFMRFRGNTVGLPGVF